MAVPGTNPIENYQPAIKYNGGIYSALPAEIVNDFTVTGATTLSGGIATTNGTVYPIIAPSVAPTAYAADTTLVAANLNTNITNTGAAGTITLTLPAVAGLTGYVFHVELTVAQIVRVDAAGTEKIYLGGSGVAGKYVNIAAVIGNMIDVYCDGTQWLVVNRDGVITKEA